MTFFLFNPFSSRMQQSLSPLRLVIVNPSSAYPASSLVPPPLPSYLSPSSPPTAHRTNRGGSGLSRSK